MSYTGVTPNEEALCRVIETLESKLEQVTVQLGDMQAKLALAREALEKIAKDRNDGGTESFCGSLAKSALERIAQNSRMKE